MKTILIDIALLLGLLVFYCTGAYSWFSSKNALICSSLLVIILLVVAYKVIGSPFRRSKDDD